MENLISNPIRPVRVSGYTFRTDEYSVYLPHQEKKSASGRTGCVRTHQALGTLRTHPSREHITPNAKLTGNVNSDAARHGTVHSDAVCQGDVHPDAARHGICLPDGACQGIFLLDAAMSGHFPSGHSRVRAFSFRTQPCQSIFLLGAAMSGQMASGRHVSWHHGHTVCQGTTFTLSAKAQNIVANTLVAFTNTQWVPGIVTQSSSIHSI